jgi:hypothetical protein
MGPIGCPETSVANYNSTIRKIPKERRSHFNRGESLKSRLSHLAYTTFTFLAISKNRGTVVYIQYRFDAVKYKQFIEAQCKIVRLTAVKRLKNEKLPCPHHEGTPGGGGGGGEDGWG